MNARFETLHADAVTSLEHEFGEMRKRRMGRPGNRRQDKC
jgi:hypothetical protein